MCVYLITLLNSSYVILIYSFPLGDRSTSIESEVFFSMGYGQETCPYWMPDTQGARAFMKISEYLSFKE